MSGTLILVAVIACIITPIVFKKLFPRESATEKKLNVVFLGANQMTLPASRELQSSLYDSTLYHTIQDKSDKNIADSLFNINEIKNYELDTLDGLGIFEADILVISTGDEEANATLSVAAKERGVERVIVRVESPDLHESLKEQEIEDYSVFLSTKAL